MTQNLLKSLDKQGNLILEPRDYVALSQNMSAKRLGKIADKAAELNRITKEAKELLVKNSEGAQGADSASGSAKR